MQRCKIVLQTVTFTALEPISDTPNPSHSRLAKSRKCPHPRSHSSTRIQHEFRRSSNRGNGAGIFTIALLSDARMLKLRLLPLWLLQKLRQLEAANAALLGHNANLNEDIFFLKLGMKAAEDEMKLEASKVSKQLQSELSFKVL